MCIVNISMFALANSLIVLSFHRFFRSYTVKSQHMRLLIPFDLKHSIQRSSFHYRATPTVIVTWRANLIPIIEY